jgi:exopolysaccharide biosynthesis protein
MIKKIFIGIVLFLGTVVFLFLLLRYSNISQIKNIRTLLVATAMTTTSHQTIAYIVATESEIKKIMSNAIVESDKRSEISDIEITKRPRSTKNFSLLQEGVYVRDISAMKFRGKLMLVLDPSRVIVGVPDKFGKKGVTVKSMVESYDAVAGINGGWYTGYEPIGFVISNNIRVFPYSEYKSSVNIVGFTSEDVLVLGPYTEHEAVGAGIRDSLTSHPIIILNGEPQITSGDGGWGIAPRTAIAQRQDGAVLFLVIDGRQFHSLGATLRQVQDVLLENDAYNAICLDGGSSTAMYYNGAYLNTPSLGYERHSPTSFLVKK